LSIIYIKSRGQYILEISETGRLGEIVDSVMAGNASLLVGGVNRAVMLDAKGWETRDIQESVVDRAVRGSREAFVETLGINLSLLRRRIRNPALKSETMTLGRVTRTAIVIAYVEGIVDRGVLAEVKNRLKRIDIDNILEGGQIEELIEDNPLSPFCTINHTDRPDKAAAQILGGNLANSGGLLPAVRLQFSSPAAALGGDFCRADGLSPVCRDYHL
jgi:spore germination protein KA